MPGETTMTWAMLMALGAFHDINPGMGWLFAVALGMQESRRRAVLRALVPLGAGHALAVIGAVGVALAIGLVIPSGWLRWPIAGLLVSLGVLAAVLIVNVLVEGGLREASRAIGNYRLTGVAKVIGIGREVTALRRDGTTVPVHLSVGEMSLAGERKFTGILHDLSARVRMEEQLREQAALARLGEMAAVIAHEVKNPLAGVRGAIQVIGSRLPQGSKDALMVREIVNRIDALNELMKDLLLFARPPQPRPVPVEVGALLETTADLLSADPALKDVHVKIDGSAAVILADAELLKIVFVNLLVNGAHAMHGRGTIHVSLAAIDGTCQIAFTDSGPGIPSGVREKIFAPFFTTKARGSGLGLPTAKRLIEAHRGSISIECPPEGGTTVVVRLPAQSSPVV